jgi:purine-cytosine permease-like protein
MFCAFAWLQTDACGLFRALYQSHPSSSMAIIVIGVRCMHTSCYGVPFLSCAQRELSVAMLQSQGYVSCSCVARQGFWGAGVIWGEHSFPRLSVLSSAWCFSVGFV